MRTLKYAILGLISREPMTGYDITREFNSNSLANFWYAKHSQVYPELSRLTEEGLATCQVVIRGERLEAKLYTITDKGRAELLEWLMECDEVPPTPKDVFRLRVYFSDLMTRQELRGHLQDQLEKHWRKCRYLTDIMEKLYNSSAPPVGTAACGDFMVLEGAVLRENAYIQWLVNCISRIPDESSETADEAGADTVSPK